MSLAPHHAAAHADRIDLAVGFHRMARAAEALHPGSSQDAPFYAALAGQFTKPHPDLVGYADALARAFWGDDEPSPEPDTLHVVPDPDGRR